MIEIKLYKNGFEIMGHSDPKTCGEVSILAWACANTMVCVDENSPYYTSATDDDESKHNDGYTYMTFDYENKFARTIYADYRHNVKQWAAAQWPVTDVQIKELDEHLMVNHFPAVTYACT